MQNLKIYDIQIKGREKFKYLGFTRGDNEEEIKTQNIKRDKQKHYDIWSGNLDNEQKNIGLEL